MTKRHFDGPGFVGFIATAAIIIVLALTLYSILPKVAQAQGVEEHVIMPKAVLIELGTKYLESISERNAMIEALQQAQKEIHRLQSATNCS